jgi:N-acetylglucosamine kinase-like BadF-type ATPase
MAGLAIGIDGGGTKTRIAAILADEPGIGLVATADAGPCNVASMPAADALANVANGISRLGIDTGSVVSICAAIAGYSFEHPRQGFADRLAAIFPNASLTVVADFYAAYVGAHGDGDGIIAIAGTGSVAYGRCGEREHRAGGYGYLIDDAGSGYGVGRSAIAAVLNAADGSGCETTLTHGLREELGAGDSAYLIKEVYGGKLDRVRIASLAGRVSDAAAAGDEVACAILRQAGQSQAESVCAVARALFSRDEPVSIALCGSLWKAGEAIVEPFAAAVRRGFPRSRIGAAEHDASVGAALLARRPIPR